MIKRTAQRKLVHQTFRCILLTGKTMRVYKYNFVSKRHNNMTVNQNKLALSPETKSNLIQNVFLFFDRISNVPCGHTAAEEKILQENIHGY